MTQHYVPPSSVALSIDAPNWPSKLLKKIIERDGLIVPILVYNYSALSPVGETVFVAADNRQSERVMACEELGFETILIEDDWEEGDL